MLSEMTRGDNELLEYELLLELDELKSRKLTRLVDFFGSIISELSSDSDFRIYKRACLTKNNLLPAPHESLFGTNL